MYGEPEDTIAEVLMAERGMPLYVAAGLAERILVALDNAGCEVRPMKIENMHHLGIWSPTVYGLCECECPRCFWDDICICPDCTDTYHDHPERQTPGGQG